MVLRCKAINVFERNDSFVVSLKVSKVVYCFCNQCGGLVGNWYAYEKWNENRSWRVLDAGMMRICLVEILSENESMMNLIADATQLADNYEPHVAQQIKRRVTELTAAANLAQMQLLPYPLQSTTDGFVLACTKEVQLRFTCLNQNDAPTTLPAAAVKIILTGVQTDAQA